MTISHSFINIKRDTYNVKLYEYFNKIYYKEKGNNR